MFRIPGAGRRRCASDSPVSGEGRGSLHAHTNFRLLSFLQRMYGEAGSRRSPSAQLRTTSRVRDERLFLVFHYQESSLFHRQGPSWRQRLHTAHLVRRR